MKLYFSNAIKKAILLFRKVRHKRDLARFRFSGIRFVPPLLDFPPVVMIDTTTRCNLACTHCPNHKLSQISGFSGDMDMALYKKIIDEISRVAPSTRVRLFDGGEPLMRKDLEAMILYAKESGMENISINTNGLLMSLERARKLIASGLNHVEFSVDAYTSETYLKIRGSRQFLELLSNIEEFLVIRKELNPKCRVAVSFVRQRVNAHEKNDFVKFWRKKVDNVLIREFHHHNLWINGEMSARPGLFRYPCPYLWTRIIIHHDGSVKFCESDWKADYKIGDIRTQSLHEIWNGFEYNKLRESHIKGEFNHPFCRNCSDWFVIRW